MLCPAAAEGGGSLRQSPAGGGAAGWAELDTEAAAERSRLEAGRRARRQVRLYCAANRLDHLGTLTYRPPGCYEPLQARADVAAFMRGLRASLGHRLPYVWVPEWHPAGHGLHVHFAVSQFIDHALIDRTWERGHTFITYLTGVPAGGDRLVMARRNGRYLGKYVGKGFAEAQDPSGHARPGLDRYDVAQGFQPVRLRLLGASEAEVLTQATALMGVPPSTRWSSEGREEWTGPPVVWASWNL